jgi:putative aminopeptidase FrvX
VNHTSLEFLTNIIGTPSPSGHETEVARLYREYVAEAADSIETDVHGNVYASMNPDASMKIMLAGHMDEIGFTIHHISEEGLLFFTAIGGHSALVPVGQMVWVYGKSRIAGAVGRKAIHLLSPDEQKKVPELYELWVDIGATSKEEASALVNLGDVLTYQYEFQPLLGSRAMARAFDNKAGLFVVAEAMRMLHQEGGLHPDVGIVCLGTVQEEVGSKGAHTSSNRIEPQSGIAVDMEHALDYPGIDERRHGKLTMALGPTISRGPNTNPIVFDLLIEAAKENRVPFQVQVSGSATPTDAKAMQASGSGMATGLIGVPLRYMHTPCEVVDLEDLQRCAQLLAGYCRLIRPTTDFTPRNSA